MSPNLMDLDYEHPAAPAGLADRARCDGRRLRRRRRALTGTAGVALATAACLAVANLGVLGGSPSALEPQVVWGSSEEAALAELPVSRGSIPDLSMSDRPGENPPIPGDVHRLVRVEGLQHVVWTTAQGWFCLGSTKDGSAKPNESICAQMMDIPQVGLWGGLMYSPDDDPPVAGGPVTWLVTGFVRGPVDEVVVHLPEGDVKARTVTTATPEAGTFYWTTTRGFDGNGDTIGKAAASEFGEDSWSVSRTVVRNGEPVFHCTGTECLVDG